MTESRFDEVVERVKALTPAEQWRLRDVLDVMLETPQAPPWGSQPLRNALI